MDYDGNQKISLGIKEQSLSWVTKHRQKMRLVILMLMIISFLGPWAFDKTHVPAKYACGPTSIRLEGDFCGHPIPGIQNFIWIIGWFGFGINCHRFFGICGDVICYRKRKFQ